MNTTTLRVCGATVVLAGLCLTLLTTSSGCIVAAKVRTVETGRHIPDGVTAQVTPGETSKTWVIDRLGQPDETEHRGDGTELLRYTVTQREETDVAIFLLVAVDVEEETSRVLTFEIQDGLVQKFFWSECVS